MFRYHPDPLVGGNYVRGQQSAAMKQGTLINQSIVLIKVSPIAGQMPDDVIEGLFTSGLEEF